MNYKNRINQKYEEYWKYTASKTDYKNLTFINSLRIIVKFIDENKNSSLENKNRYEIIQKDIAKNNSWTGPSWGPNSRKEINTWVKNGFLYPGLKKYHYLSKEFLNARSDFEKNTLLAKVFLENNQFNASATKKDKCRKNRVKFLLRTLENNKKLSKNDLMGIMFCDPDGYEKDYLDKKELNELNKYAKSINAFDRKYNQLGHLRSALKCLDKYIVFIDDVLHFRDDDNEIQKISKSKNKPSRSQAEQQVYRDMLIIESNNALGLAEDNSRAKCMLSGLPMSKAKIVASHIWAYDKCDEDAEYDPNNGLLLGENADYYFDSGKISFDNDGKVLISVNVPDEWRSVFSTQSLNKIFLNDKRKDYLKKHRQINGFENI